MSKAQLSRGELAAIFRLLDRRGEYLADPPEQWFASTLVAQIRVILSEYERGRAELGPVDDAIEPWIVAAAAADRRKWAQVNGDIQAAEFDGGCGYEPTILVTPATVALVGAVPGMSLEATRELVQLLVKAIDRAGAMRPLPELEHEASPEELGRRTGRLIAELEAGRQAEEEGR